MKVLAVVPARGGSRRLPGKNTRLLGGKPLLAWTLDVARAETGLSAVLVSTDDDGIAEVARAHGASVPWLRPAGLATDAASSIDVVLHALDWYEGEQGAVDGVMLLQPTSPFRSPGALRKALEMFGDDRARPIASVSPVAHPPAWCFHLEHDRMQPLLGWDALSKRSQDIAPCHALNGAIFLSSPAGLRETRTFLHARTRALVMDAMGEAVDIDTLLDWALAEAVLACLNGGARPW